MLDREDIMLGREEKRSAEKNKTSRGLETLLAHLSDWSKLGLCLKAIHVATSYVAEVIIPNFDM